MKSKFKELDMYGEQMSFTYKGEPSFRTTPGAIVSLLIIICMGGFSLYKFYNFIERNNPSISKEQYQRDLANVPPMIPHEYGFEIAFGMSVPLDPSYGYYQANNIVNSMTNLTDSSGNFIR
jgi:hypothetical protein